MTTDISAYFSSDPEKLTRSNITEIIKVFRGARHLFNTTGKAAPKKLTGKQQEASDAAGKISLTDLGL